MKTIVSVVSTLMQNRTSRTNLLALMKLVLVLVLLITAYSITFHMLMEREGQHHSWVTGFYWTLTVMSTLGFGDITFESDAGRIFSILVMVSGVIFLLVILPFTFIEFFYAPWMKAQESAKAPIELPEGTSGHVIFTNYGPVTSMLIRMLEENDIGYVVLVPSVEKALDMRDKNIPVVCGDPSDPKTYTRVGVEKAAMVVTTLDDVTNTNVTFTVRELTERVPIIASATAEQIRDALELAGVTHILRLEEIMGQALARRVIGNDAEAHVIGELKGLIIAEASPAKTPLVGKTIAESGLRGTTGVTVVGIWTRGRFEPVEPDTRIGEHTVLVLAGSQEHFDRYNEVYGKHVAEDERLKVVIVGGGRVGRATSRALTEAGIPWTIIEKLPERVRHIENAIIGDAADFEVLVEAGLQEAASVIVTTHDDETNVFLTIFYRRLRNGLQIISRCTHESKASRLHRAGADLTLSYASMGANTIFNHIRGSDTVLLAEGINIFKVNAPRALAGKTLMETAVRSRTGCSIIAVERDGERVVNPDPDILLPEDGALVLIGSLEAEKNFRAAFPCQDS
ncbi:potassium channel family protein [Haloferula rosea]|uniref:Potassium channel protein n=1 Tax=Haloferula rosea TaxID=490093 RepID=A0A934VGY2_9BACT|nr:NAD-binding protein [Haloferula rosea]MBK1828065.1 potassium channel protein [Haloferula rosea]